ncbi:MAG TPA: methyltransferase domain-containing protein [Alphaproteobacteria bacterium]|nr:methyltransferase domain-containing protein [Alphaproteobacteria bacterium]
MADIDDVRRYWDRFPLLSHEIGEIGTPAFFETLDRIKRMDSERFALPFWEFEKFRGKRVLDDGCGPGWFTVQYAAAGALVEALDLAPRAVQITRDHLAYRGLSADVRVANAEELPFPDKSFDLVFSSGVLHHTPNTFKAFTECRRVLKPGGRAKITLYRKGFAHGKLAFVVTRFLMRLGRIRHPGADLARDARDVDDFIRQYDGAGNPIGIAMSDSEWAAMLEKAGFRVGHFEVHFFPRRFLPFARFVPSTLHRLLDALVGTMVYFDLSAP